MDRADRIAVTVAYALPQRQTVIALELPAGATAGEAVQRSGLLDGHAEIRQRPLELSIFGRIVPESAPLRTGDRVEVLRPLAQDPKQTRRMLAARGRTMGRSGRR